MTALCQVQDDSIIIHIWWQKFINWFSASNFSQNNSTPRINEWNTQKREEKRREEKRREEKRREEKSDWFNIQFDVLYSSQKRCYATEMKLKSFDEFWLEWTLKMVNCSSIVIKLFAWEQIQDIIKEARLTRPPANRYLVRNAGTNEVNGIYVGNFKRGRFRSTSRNQKSMEWDYFLCFVAQCDQNRNDGSSR